MGKLISLAMLLMTAACTATVIAAAALAGYGFMQGYLSKEKIGKMVAVAQGAELASAEPNTKKAAVEETRPEQPSFDQVIEARAVKTRNLELREQAVVNATNQLRAEQTKLGDSQTALKKAQQAYAEQLANVEKRSSDLGWDANRRDLSALKPKQAKELILLMVKKDEIKQVVSLLLPMPDQKRAKIFAEFKTPEDLERVDEIMRLVRQGEPLAGVAAAAEQTLDRGPTTAGQEGRP